MKSFIVSGKPVCHLAQSRIRARPPQYAFNFSLSLAELALKLLKSHGYKQLTV